MSGDNSRMVATAPELGAVGMSELMAVEMEKIAQYREKKKHQLQDNLNEEMRKKTRCGGSESKAGG
jgi:hypothetical protein